MKLFSVLVLIAACICCLASLPFVQAQQTTVTCTDQFSDCSYEGDGIGITYVCENGGNCFCNNAETCQCQGNAGDCNCGYSTTCFCDDNDGDCCYTASSNLAIDTSYGGQYLTSDGICWGDASSSSDYGVGPARTTLIVVGVCLGVLLILLVIAAVIRRRRYRASLESDVVYSPVPTYGVSPTPVSYNPYNVPQSGYTPNSYQSTNRSTPTQQYNFYPTPNNYGYTATSTNR